MTTTASEQRTASSPARRSRGVRVLRFVGWTLIAAGVVVLLYLFYSLYFTNFETDAAQRQMRAAWEHTVAAREVGDAGTTDEAPETDAAPETNGAAAPEPDALDPADLDTPAEAAEEAAEPDLGSAIALVEFVRPGSDEPPVRDEPVVVVDGVTREALTRGPGHYPDTALPGQDGNFAIAGHRTTYGAPFFHLDELDVGDEIHVTDREGVTHVYEFVEQRIVGPADAWVLEPDPLDRDAATLTLTTCHPRFSARQRLVVFAELVS